MKKLLPVFLLVILSSTCFSACALKHEHIYGGWAADEEYHCRIFIECTWKKFGMGCKVEPAYLKHEDTNNDSICDVCNYPISTPDTPNE